MHTYMHAYLPDGHARYTPTLHTYIHTYIHACVHACVPTPMDPQLMTTLERANVVITLLFAVEMAVGCVCTHGDAYGGRRWGRMCMFARVCVYACTRTCTRPCMHMPTACTDHAACTDEALRPRLPRLLVGHGHMQHAYMRTPYR